MSPWWDPIRWRWSPERWYHVIAVSQSAPSTKGCSNSTHLAASAIPGCLSLQFPPRPAQLPHPVCPGGSCQWSMQPCEAVAQACCPNSLVGGKPPGTHSHPEQPVGPRHCRTGSFSPSKGCLLLLLEWSLRASGMRVRKCEGPALRATWKSCEPGKQLAASEERVSGHEKGTSTATGRELMAHQGSAEESDALTRRAGGR